VTTGRRRFIVKAGGALAALAAGSMVAAPNVIAQPKIQWRMSTTWTPLIDVLQGAAQRLATVVAEITGGRFRIDVVPGGQIMPLFACFDAASQGTIEAFMGSGQYWSDREPALEFLTTIPFGMNPEGMRAWYYQGEGLTLCEETYAAFHLVPRPAMSNSPQMAGWFRRKINTIADFKGFKMRIPSLGGKVVTRAGATTVLTPGSEIYAALERGVIDASEWISPHDDMKLGLHKTARYFYAPGWHEPGTTLIFGFNKKAYEALPVELQRALDHAAAAVHVYGRTEFRLKNAVALETLRREFKGKVEVLPLPPPVLRDLKKLAVEVVRQEAEKSSMARKVHASFTKFQAAVGPWDEVAEAAYHRLIGG
jgi:TRAP-type mannitol/chloroaromatic compound transport system substrate-binding protein